MTEAPFTDLNYVNTSGYSESKWVSERILWTAGQQTSLRPVIVRVGQLSGGLNGNWNVREWFPALVRASQVVGGAPGNKGVCIYLSHEEQATKVDHSSLARIVCSTSRGSFGHHRASTHVGRVCSYRAPTSCSLG